MARFFFFFCASVEEEDTIMSYEEEDTCMSYEEEDTYLGNLKKLRLLLQQFMKITVGGFVVLDLRTIFFKSSQTSVPQCVD
jgi:hypothetical protein